MRLGGDLYVRSVHGRTSAWFRGVQTRHERHIWAGGVEKEVTFVEETDAGLNDQIDTAYTAKYRRYARILPSNFDIYNRVAMYDVLEDCRHEYKRWVPDDEKAAICIQCDECLSKCPQSIAISTWLPVVEEVLGLGRPYVNAV